MKWRGRRGSSNVEDRRGQKAALGGGISVGGLLFLLGISFVLGVNPLKLLNLVGNAPLPAQPRQQAPAEDPNDEAAQFVKVVLADTEDVWNDLLPRAGVDYQEPKLVLFNDGVRSACGFNSAAVGPFYCPGDRKVYIDLDFFNQLARQLNAPGDFAQAYVIAHEVGHHVQNLLGQSDFVHSQRNRVSEEEYNQLSVRLELQADFYAGVWAHHAQQRWNILEPGDLEEALIAAQAIGDDTLQKRSKGYIVPESFTHGTSEQRIRWFRLGFETGDPAQGRTFKLPYSEL